MRTIPILLLVVLFGCSDYFLEGDDDTVADDDDASEAGDDDAPGECESVNWPAEEVGVADDTCGSEPSDDFSPVVEWSYSPGGGCLSLPTVGDLDGDGASEIVVNVTDLFSNPGDLVVLRGDGSGPLWTDPFADLGYAVSTALGDLDGDGSPEIVAVREYATSMWGGAGDYTVVAYSGVGAQLWESEHFQGYQVDFQSAPVISDMDHDGSPEIVAGRVILHADGQTRAVGSPPAGTSASFMIPAVTDLDLDGVEEVIGADAWYDIDGNTLRHDATMAGWGLVAVANLDGDPEGEVVVTVGESVHALDTDGTPFWAPSVTIANGQLASSPAIGELDGDGQVEIVVAGGSRLHCINHDGTVLWSAEVTDMTGATGASIFDFEGDGIPEVVYIDEIQILVYEGPTGQLKYRNTDHSSNTMWEYPVIADVDGDDSAEIVVCHNSIAYAALSVFGSVDDVWAPARPVWNQHAYHISNVNDDLTIPDEATPAFSHSNTWHSALTDLWEPLGVDLYAEVLEVCTDDCDEGIVWVTVRLLNRGPQDAAAGVDVTLYAKVDGVLEVVATAVTDAPIASGWASDPIELQVPAQSLEGATFVSVVADDDGTGTGAVDECNEGNNYDERFGPFCE